MYPCIGVRLYMCVCMYVCTYVCLYTGIRGTRPPIWTHTRMHFGRRTCGVFESFEQAEVDSLVKPNEYHTHKSPGPRVLALLFCTQVHIYMYTYIHTRMNTHNITYTYMCTHTWLGTHARYSGRFEAYAALCVQRRSRAIRCVHVTANCAAKP